MILLAINICIQVQLYIPRVLRYLLYEYTYTKDNLKVFHGWVLELQHNLTVHNIPG